MMGGVSDGRQVGGGHCCIAAGHMCISFCLLPFAWQVGERNADNLCICPPFPFASFDPSAPPPPLPCCLLPAWWPIQLSRQSMYKILGEDKVMIERLQPEQIRQELSLEADKPQLAFRKLRQVRRPGRPGAPGWAG